jgi:TM2 domain-containing membrane protein YozV
MARVSGRSPVLALILSMLIPGVGSFYAGEIGKGIMFVILDLVAWFLVFSVVGALIGVPALVVIWIWAMVAAYNACKAPAPTG